jgi:hypothetical protein
MGGSGDNTLIGASDGGDSLTGGTGNDTILGGGNGGDSIVGGGGLSFAQYNANDTVSQIYAFIDPPAPVVETQAAAVQIAAPATDTGSDGTIAVTLNGPILKVIASNGNDTIVVSQSSGDLIVTIDGTAQDSFPSSEVTGIKLYGSGSGDVLAVDASVKQSATLHGTGGDDSLAAGGGSTVVMGEGSSDTLVGGGGTSLLIPGQRGQFSDQSVNDSLVGGSGYTIADFALRTDSTYLSNNGQADSGDVSDNETTTIATNVNAIWGGSASDTIIGTTSGMFLSGGSGTGDSIIGTKASDLIAGGSAGGNEVIAQAQPVVLDLRNNAADQYQGATNASIDIIVADTGMDSLVTNLPVVLTPPA